VIDIENLSTDLFVKPSKECPKYMRYQAWGRVRDSQNSVSIAIDNEVEGIVNFPPHYLDVDKEKTLFYKLTQDDSYET